MLKTTLVCLLAGLLPLPLVGSSEPQGGYRDLFCPACEQYVSNEWALDDAGACRTCGRVPVEVEARTRRWFWCEKTRAWGDEPCMSVPDRHCAEWTATAMVLDLAATRVAGALFCPACRTFAESPGREEPCEACRRPRTEALMAMPTWWWCPAQLRWGEAPCFGSRKGGCDTARTVKVLAASPLLPRILSRN
jgi:hypothetical protein